MKLQTGWARSEGFSYFGALTLGPPPRHLSEWIDLTYLRKFLKPVIYPGNVCVQFMSIESWGLFANNKSTWHLCYQACGSFTSQNVTKSVLEAIKTIDIEGLRTTKVHTVIMPAVHTGAINRAKSLILPTREKRTRENRIHRRKSDETDPRARFPNLLCRIIPIDSSPICARMTKCICTCWTTEWVFIVKMSFRFDISGGWFLWSLRCIVHKTSTSTCKLFFHKYHFVQNAYLSPSFIYLISILYVC